MRYSVNKDSKTIELLPSVFTTEELSELMEQFEGYSFSVSFSPKKQGMVVGANYISIIGNTEYN